MPRLNSWRCCCTPPPPNTTADRAADLLAATSALGYLREARATAAPEAAAADRADPGPRRRAGRRAERGRRLALGVGEPAPMPGQNRPPRHPSDRLTSARGLLGAGLGRTARPADRPQGPRPGGRPPEPASSPGSAATTCETRAALLHALAARRAASFEQANSLNRSAAMALRLRARLPGADLRQPRPPHDGRRGARRPRPAGQDRGDRAGPACRGCTGMARAVRRSPGPPPRPPRWSPLAFARVRPQAPELDAGRRLARSPIASANGWQPHKAKGPALAALAAYYGKAPAPRTATAWSSPSTTPRSPCSTCIGAAEGKAVARPAGPLKVGRRQPRPVRDRRPGPVRLRGHATRASPATSAPTRTATNRVAMDRPPRLSPGRPRSSTARPCRPASRVAVNPTTFENLATQVGARRPGPGRDRPPSGTSRANTPEWERDFLVVAGAPARRHDPDRGLGAVRRPASYELADGVLTFYFAPERGPGPDHVRRLRLPARPATAPCRPRSGAPTSPGRSTSASRASSASARPGEPSTDPYKPTPDELYARGKAHFDAGRLAEAGEAARSRSSAATPSATTSPRTPRGCSC